MTPYQVYMDLVKAATDNDTHAVDMAFAQAAPALNGLVGTSAGHLIENVADPRNSALYGASRYLHKNKRDIMRQSAQNIAFGVMSNPRGSGPISVVGSSAGGVLDGVLFKPMVDSGIKLVGRGLRRVYGVKGKLSDN